MPRTKRSRPWDGGVGVLVVGCFETTLQGLSSPSHLMSSHAISCHFHLKNSISSISHAIPLSSASSPGRSLPLSGTLLLIRHCLGQVSKRSTYRVHTCCCEMDMHTSSHRSTLRSCTIHHPSTHPHCVRISFAICLAVQKHSHVYPPLPWDCPFFASPPLVGQFSWYQMFVSLERDPSHIQAQTPEIDGHRSQANGSVLLRGQPGNKRHVATITHILSHLAFPPLSLLSTAYTRTALSYLLYGRNMH